MPFIVAKIIRVAGNPAGSIPNRRIIRLSRIPPVSQIVDHPDSSLRHVLLKKSGGIVIGIPISLVC